MEMFMREELDTLLAKIYNGESDLISTLTPDMLFAMLANCHDDGFAVGKDSVRKEVVCLMNASGMCEDEISLILNINAEVVRDIVERKKAHIEKCVKKLEKRRKKEQQKA